MIPIEHYWSEDKPTLEDVKFAYNRASQGVVVEIRWFVKYSGHYNRLVTPNDTEDMNAETYFNEIIPKCYPV